MDQDGGYHSNPAKFAVAASQAASARSASIISAHTSGQIVSIITVLTADQPAAVAVALGVVSDALKRSVASSTADVTVIADLARLPCPAFCVTAGLPGGAKVIAVILAEDVLLTFADARRRRGGGGGRGQAMA